MCKTTRNLNCLFSVSRRQMQLVGQLNRFKSHSTYQYDFMQLVGLEPTYLAVQEPKSCASANSAITAAFCHSPVVDNVIDGIQ